MFSQYPKFSCSIKTCLVSKVCLLHENINVATQQLAKPYTKLWGKRWKKLCIFDFSRNYHFNTLFKGNSKI